MNNNISNGALTFDNPPTAVPTNYRAIAGGSSGGNADITSNNWYSRFPYSYWSPSFGLSGATCTDDGTFTTFTSTVALTNQIPATNKFIRFDYDESNMIPVESISGGGTFIKLQGVNHNGQNICTNFVNVAGTMDIWEVNPDTTQGTHLTAVEASDINSHCPGASLGDKYFVCSSGLDVTEDYQGVDGVGTQRVLDYFLIGESAATTPPIWVMENNNMPELFIRKND